VSCFIFHINRVCCCCPAKSYLAAIFSSFRLNSFRCKTTVSILIEQDGLAGGNDLPFIFVNGFGKDLSGLQ
jgi:hypothetical protein